MFSFLASLEPQFFDIFGIGVFGFITALFLWSLWKRSPLPHWSLIALLIIGILGLLVDGTIVYRSYF